MIIAFYVPENGSPRRSGYFIELKIYHYSGSPHEDHAGILQAVHQTSFRGRILPVPKTEKVKGQIIGYRAPVQ